MANLRGRSSAAKITLDCKVTKVMYAGDEGGIMCHLTFDEEEKEEVFLVSITHLSFDRKLPVARGSRPIRNIASSASAATMRPMRLPPITKNGNGSPLGAGRRLT